jgi:hypothetical protein
MDQLLAKIFRYVPEWFFVLVLIGLGVAFFFYDAPLTTVCDAQINDFAQGQNGRLFPKAVNVLNPLTGGPYVNNNLSKSRKQCIESVQGMGCYSYFKIVQGVLFDFQKLSPQCLMELSAKPLISKMFDDYIITMVRLAWGDRPPLSQTNKNGFLTDSDISTYCKMRKFYNVFYPQARWDALSRYTLSLLVEDPLKTQSKKLSLEEKFEDEVKEEKEYVFKKASMDFNRAYELSLLTMDCLYYE